MKVPVNAATVPFLPLPVPVPLPKELIVTLDANVIVCTGTHLFLFECSCMWNVRAIMGPKANGVARNTIGLSDPYSVTSAKRSTAEAMLVRLMQKKSADRIVFFAPASFGSATILVVPLRPQSVAPFSLCLATCLSIDFWIMSTMERLHMMMTIMRVTVTRMYAMEVPLYPCPVQSINVRTTRNTAPTDTAQKEVQRPKGCVSAADTLRTKTSFFNRRGSTLDG